MDQDLANELKRLRDERQKKFSEEDWEGALEIHDRILELSPSALRYANRGSILYRLGRLDQAVDSYRKALEMDPTLKRARADLERLEAQQAQKEKKPKEEPPKAEVGAQTMKTQMPPQNKNQKRINELREKRQKKLESEDWEGALHYHNMIIEIEPTALRYANLGSIYFRMHKISDAIQAYKKALEIDPSLERAKYDLQRLESQMEEEELLGNEANADDVSEQIENLRKQRQEKVQAGDWEEALRIHNQILEIEPTALRYANRGALLYRMGRYKEALESYQKASDIDPVITASKQDDIQKLEALIEEEALLAPESADQELSAEERAEKIKELRNERQKYLDVKDWQKALDVHDKIIETEPTALRYVNRGSMCYRMKDLESAIKSYRIALEMEPNLGRAQRDLARMEEELAKQNVEKQLQKEKEKKEQEEKETPKAEPVKKKAPKLSKEEIAEKILELRQSRKKMIEEEKWDEALAMQDEIVRLEPTALRYASRGSLLYRIGRVDEAIFSYREALKLDPNCERAQMDIEGLAETEMDRLRESRRTKMQDEDWEGALEVHDIILALQPTPLRYANRGSIFYRMDRLREAAECYKKALEMDPELEKAKEDLAELQEQLQEGLMAVPEEFEEDEEDILDEVDEMEEMEEEEEELEEEEVNTSLDRHEEFSVSILDGHTKQIMQLKVFGSTIVSFSKDNSIKIWDINSKECKQTLKGHKDWIRDIATVNKNSEIVSASDDWTVKIWDKKTGECKNTFIGHTMPVTCVAASSNNRHLFSGGRDQNILVWDLNGNKQISELIGHEDWISCIVLTPKADKVITASYDSTIRIWNILGWRCVHTLEGHDGWVEKLLITPDGKHLISSSSDKTMQIWDISSGKSLSSLSQHNDRIIDMQLSSDGTLLASAGRDLCIHLWKIPDGTLKATFRGKLSKFSAISISPDGKTLFAADNHKNIWIWDIESEKLLDTWEEPQLVSSLACVENKKWLISGSHDGKIKIWDYSTIV